MATTSAPATRRYTFEQFTTIRRYQPTLSFSSDGCEIAYSTNTSGQFNLGGPLCAMLSSEGPGPFLDRIDHSHQAAARCLGRRRMARSHQAGAHHRKTYRRIVNGHGCSRYCPLADIIRHAWLLTII